MKSIFAVLMSLVSGFAIVTAQANEAIQPKMDAATELLQQARDSKEPLPLLEKAADELHHAKHNKGGRRPEAIQQVEEAIALVKDGKDATAKITHALALVRSGIDRGR